jgi:hypothetical protein
MKDELLHLLDEERPEIVKIVSWAASNGDRSENGDYQYGKKRLREIDRRIYFLTKRLEDVLVVDPEARDKTDQIFFGATVYLFIGYTIPNSGALVRYKSEFTVVLLSALVGLSEVPFLKRMYSKDII